MKIMYEKPKVGDGKEIWKLVKNSSPLDVNSEYLYLLLCQHFSNTCVIAKADSKIVGFISAYILPNQKDTIFVWQVAVAKEFRKKGISTNMMKSILSRPVCESVSYLEATVTPSNVSSRKMFESVASYLKCDIKTSSFFTIEHFNEAHEPEDLVRIGPIKK